MKRIIHILGAVMLLLALPGAAYEGLDQGFRTAEAGLNEEEMAGAELWYKATAGTTRFTTYVFQQRMGVLIDWFRVLRADQHGDRFETWGLINDPGCCVPGSAGCPARSMEETYGFEYCPGDEQLLKYVGKTGYRDPGCDFKDPGGLGNKQNPCDLEFGTSTGALGFRKLPNPRFDAENWRKINGGQLGTWNGYRQRRPSAPGSTMMVSHLADPSIEPPFLIGMACGACHIAFNPLKPPRDTANPQWENLKLLIGNQYLRSSEIMASGMPVDSPEWQLFSHERPGTVDTSAIPNDGVHNPGTMNAIISFASRPHGFKEKVAKWRPAASCPPGDDTCWCEPGTPGKCRQWSSQEEEVFHILKGGEDSIGAEEAIQRVYFNIGSCSEECWLNHLTDLRQLDPTQRNFGQTPFDIGQCRRDCPGFRAIEDRLGLIAKFFLASKPADLWQARGLEDPGDLVEQLEAEHGKGAVTRGKRVFVESCARCHSSQPNPTENTDFLAVDRAGHRIDWLGNDEVKEASEVATYRCRALHSNHMQGHVWEQYGSETYRNRPAVTGITDKADGGRGYYRNISLINAWAHAPFLHNNAMGPEICGKPSSCADDQGLDKCLYRSPYVKIGKQGGQMTYARAGRQDDCVAYDPSVEGRYKLFEASLDELLNPRQRQDKVSLLDQDIRIDFGLRTFRGHNIRSFKLSVPEGLPAGRLVSLDFKPFVADLVLTRTDKPELERRLTERLGSREAARRHTRWLKGIRRRIIAKALFTQKLRLNPADAQVLFDVYDTCTADVENAGHPFGESLSAEDKAALTAFLATL
ncbi:MAG: cytochrome c [Thermoanaerobaculia bacterium]